MTNSQRLTTMVPPNVSDCWYTGSKSEVCEHLRIVCHSKKRSELFLSFVPDLTLHPSCVIKHCSYQRPLSPRLLLALWLGNSNDILIFCYCRVCGSTTQLLLRGGHRDKKRGQIAGEREWIELDGWLPGGEIAEAKP